MFGEVVEPGHPHIQMKDGAYILVAESQEIVTMHDEDTALLAYIAMHSIFNLKYGRGRGAWPSSCRNVSTSTTAKNCQPKLYGLCGQQQLMTREWGERPTWSMGLCRSRHFVMQWHKGVK